MTKTTSFRRKLFAGAAVLSLSALGGLSLIGPANSQSAPQVMQEARPQMMAPNANLIAQLSFADLVEEVSPAVVSIRTEMDIPVQRRMSLPPEFEKMLPEEFRGRSDGGETFRKAHGEGSGFFIDAKGHVVTNNHVVEGAEEITVVTDDGQELPATLVGTDPSTDLAVLKVEPTSGQRYVRFAPNTDLRVGDYVLAVGNPFGLGGSVTSGIVSALGREDHTRRTQYADFIQIDASINRGNSGGPTFDLKGNVVGVNTAIISPTGGNVGIGLAIPADVASEVVAQLIDEGSVTRGWLGVSIGDLDDRLASAVGLETEEGALIQQVQDDSPAKAAGFKDGDVVLEFNGRKIDDAATLTRTVGAIAPGKTVKAKVFRDGKNKTLSVKLAKRDPEGPRAAVEGSGANPGSSLKDEMKMDLGVTFSSLSQDTRDRLGLADDVHGVLVTDVDRNSEAAEAGIREGMVITRADNKAVKTLSDIDRAVRDAKARGKEAVLVRVQTARQGGFFLALPINDKGQG